MCRVFTSFTLETILSTAFGRQVDIQRGESDELSKSIDKLFASFTGGRFEALILLHSKPYACLYIIDYSD